VAEYVIGLSVQGEPAIESAAKATDKLDDSLERAQQAARDAARAYDEVNESTKKLWGNTGKLGDAAEQFDFGNLDSTFSALGGPLGETGARIFEVVDAFQMMNRTIPLSSVAVAGFSIAGVAAVGMLVKLAAAAVAAGAAIAGIAIAAGNAANKTDLMRDVMTGSVSASAALTATIQRVSTRVPVAASEVARLGDELYKAGKRGKDLEKALLEASYEAAGLGKNPGPDKIARRMANLDVIGAKLKDNIASIFAGPGTKRATGKFGTALSGLTERFGENRAEGRGLRTLFETIATPLINGLTKLMPLATKVFRALIILALDVAIAVVKARNAILKMIPKSVKKAIKELAESETAMEVATYAIVAVIVILAVVLAALVAVLVILAVLFAVALFGAVMVVLLPFILVAAAIAAVIAVIYLIGKAIAKAVTYLGALGKAAGTAAKSLISGLVNGIKNGASAVATAIKNMASNAISAMKSALKIASPSKIFEDIGAYTGEGFTVGVEAETEGAQSALEAMVSPPDPNAAQVPTRVPNERTAGMAGAGGVTINLYGVEGAADAIKQIEDAVTRLFEGDAIAAGAG